MSTQTKPPAPPSPTVNDGGGDWSDFNIIHYSVPKFANSPQLVALCGFEVGEHPQTKIMTEEQELSLPLCPVCLALAKYDGRWKLP